MPFAKTWIDLENIILNKVTQKEKDKYHVSLICGIQNMAKNEPIYEIETDSQKLLTDLGLHGWMGCGRGMD